MTEVNSADNVVAMSERDIKQWAKDIGAFTWKELGEAYHLERPAVVKVLGKGMLEGWISMPWTSPRAMQVWFKHEETKWASAGSLRDASRIAHPDLWPNMGKNKRRELGLTNPKTVKGKKPKVATVKSRKPRARNQQQNEDVKTLAKALRGAEAASINELSVRLNWSREKVIRVVSFLEDAGVVVSKPDKTGKPGRPSKLWSMANPKKDD